MGPTPKVSVVTTVHNGSAYMERSVPSILRQTYTTFEWIIIDDASTDDTLRQLEGLLQHDNRARVECPGRLGRARALNYGINLARGRYIIQQDFDDVSYPDRIVSQVNCLDQFEDVGLVGGYYVVQDQNRNEHYVRRPPIGHEGIVRSMACWIPFAHTITAFRKKCWEQAGGYPELDDIEDFALWLEFAKYGWKFANLPQVLGEHWVHPESYWHRNFSYSVRQRKLAAMQFRAIRELGLPKWMVVYPAARYLYAKCPVRLKRIIRRTVGGSREVDVEAGRSHT
jgi:glycosyltransferase EpsE